jgi:hypothetical protein
MYHIINPNTLYDILNEMKIEVNVNKGKEKVDVAQFLDDVSSWMDANRVMLSEEYLPFCVLSVGVTPVQVSAFMYGCFVGKAMEKHKLKLKLDRTPVDKNVMMREIEANMKQYEGLLSGGLGFKPKENNDDNNLPKSRR